MVLKKQTAWLLTMLSLIIVLSVYYIVSPGESPTNVAYVEDEEKQTNNEAKDAKEELETSNKEAAEDQAEVTTISSDETFAALRIKINEAREKQLAEYQEVVASGEISAEMKSEAFNKMEKLNDQSQQITVLETLLMNQLGYDDVIVNPIDGENFNIIVKADEVSKKEANDIMRKTVEQLGEGNVSNVTVEYAK
ncbi:stage III sporulation protein AH [Pueribacillus theae]|uniref:Stage III sporulation protein AH n=1 Tax=Pueribacillus theae TaxID=2171751 RepID=A0A2U1K6R1_9BACI|nr:SpoIIIAH-like family protein [Pueribacillus theae]PWA13216.1 stage III sporulation protein AH [Pueribacillus theae]